MSRIQEITKKSKETEGNQIAQVHHLLMKEYGWIPFEEFKRLPTTLVASLLDEIHQQKERERKAWEKAKRKGKRKK